MEDNRKTRAEDDVSHNAHYENGIPEQPDKRDEKDSKEDWNAEKNRTGRHK